MLSSKSQLSPNQMHQLLKISDYSEQGQLVILTSMLNKAQIIRAIS